MRKNIIFTFILTASVSSFSNGLCINSYKSNSQRWIEESKITFKTVSEILKPQQKQIELSIRNYNKPLPQKRDSKKIDEFQKIMNEKMPIEVAEVEAKRLAKSGFLLGPIHEFIFSMSLNIKDYGFTSDSMSTHPINKYKTMLEHFQERVKDSSPDGKKYRREIAESMYQLSSKLLRNLPDDANSFLIHGDGEKLAMLDRSFALLTSSQYSFNTNLFFNKHYKTSTAHLLKMMTSLLENQFIPGRKEFLISLYENSLLEISGNILSRTRNPKSELLHRTAALSPIIAAPLAMWNALPANDAGLIVPFTVISSVTFGLLSNPVYKKTTEYSLNAWIGAKNFFNRGKVNKKLVTFLEDSSNDITTAELAKIENIEDQLDLKFSYIKHDLVKDLSSEVNLPTWGQEVGTGINNISLRINILLEQYQSLVSQLDPTVKKILTEKKSLSSDEIKKLNFNKDAIVLQLVNFLIDMQAIKTDTLSLSVALDHFIERAQSSKTKSQVIEYFLESKENQFLQQIEILKSLAQGMNKIENQLTLNIDAINNIYNSQDINLILDIDSRLKIE